MWGDTFNNPWLIYFYNKWYTTELAGRFWRATGNFNTGHDQKVSEHSASQLDVYGAVYRHRLVRMHILCICVTGVLWLVWSRTGERHVPGTLRSIISCSSCTMSSLRLSCRVDILCSSSSLRCLIKERKLYKHLQTAVYICMLFISDIWIT